MHGYTSHLTVTFLHGYKIIADCPMHVHVTEFLNIPLMIRNYIELRGIAQYVVSSVPIQFSIHA